ncbi:MAG: NAD-dependent epimerase/dehydratase family protein [Alphaproteobacteria bacterium]
MSLYLITGGAGFIGHHLAADLLTAGHRLRVIDDLSNARTAPKFTCDFIRADLAKENASLNEWLSDVDGCFHLAATASVERSEKEWRKAHDSNLVAGLNLFRALAAIREKTGREIPVAYASSAAVYGARSDGDSDSDGNSGGNTKPLSENSPTQPCGAYGADKLAMESHARAIGAVSGLQTAGARIFNAFGDGQDPHSPYSGVISIFLGNLKAGRDLTIFGNGKQSRDFVHVLDVSRLLRAALSAASHTGPVWNICSGRSTTITELAEHLLELAKIHNLAPSQTSGQTSGQGNGKYAKSAIQYKVARVADAQSVIGSPEKAARDLGLRAEITLEKGLAELICNQMKK